MRRTLPGAVTVLILLVTAMGLPLAAQEPPPGVEAPPGGGGLELEVRRLHATLTHLVALLRRQVESSNAGVMMQRVRLMTDRLAPLEEALRAARDEEAWQRDRLQELEMSTSSLRSQLETQLEIGEITDEVARIRQEQSDRMYEANKKQIDDRLWAAQQRVIDLEQEIAERRAVLETLEGEVDRVLGLR